jgi:hypothetical protein
MHMYLMTDCAMFGFTASKLYLSDDLHHTNFPEHLPDSSVRLGYHKVFCMTFLLNHATLIHMYHTEP